MMAPINVTVDDEHLASIDDVAEALRAKGMDVDAVHGAVGIITGTAPAEVEPSLGAVDGVASVHRQLQYRVPRPDAEIQ